jgi:hypothetical protein
VGSGFGLTVQADDSSDDLITSFNGTVTVGLASNPGGTTLGGTLTVGTSGGVATFSGLTLTTAASGYTLYVSASGPTPTTTNSFNVVSSTTSSALPAASTSSTPKASPPRTVRLDRYRRRRLSIRIECRVARVGPTTPKHLRAVTVRELS